MAERDYESEALAQGWNPEFSGPNKTDAKTFVEKGEKIAGMAIANRDRERTEFEQRFQKLERASQEAADFNRQARDRDKAKNEVLIAELETLRATAITNGDGAEFTRVDRQIEQARSDMAPPNGDSNPLGNAWLINNDWYSANRKLQIHADGIANEIRSQGYADGSPAFFAEITRQVRADFPEEFENKRQSGANSVEQSNDISKPDKTAKVYENLDVDGKAACDSFVAEGLMTKEEYCADYEWNR